MTNMFYPVAKQSWEKKTGWDVEMRSTVFVDFASRTVKTKKYTIFIEDHKDFFEFAVANVLYIIVIRYVLGYLD